MSDQLKPIRTAYKRAIQVWFCEYNGPPMDCQRRTKPSSLAFNIEPTDPFSEWFLWFSIGLIRVFLRFELEINFISRFRIFFKAIASLITVPYFIPSHSIYAPTWSRKTRPARIFSCFHVAEWRETFDFRLNTWIHPKKILTMASFEIVFYFIFKFIKLESYFSGVQEKNCIPLWRERVFIVRWARLDSLLVT